MNTSPLNMARMIRYFVAGLSAIGVAGRPGHSVYFDVFGAREDSRDRSRTDAQALHSDWEAVGRDLRKSMKVVDKEIKDKQPA